MIFSIFESFSHQYMSLPINSTDLIVNFKKIIIDFQN